MPQRQSPAAIFIILWSTSLKLLKGFWPVLVLYLFKDEKDENSLSILAIIVVFCLISLVGTVISYWFKTFYLSEGNLIIKSGWLKKETLSIPFANIQAVHLEQNVWQQALDVAKVSFDATGSEKVEVQLDALAVGKAEDLKNLLMDNKTSGEEPHSENPSPQASVYNLKFKDLIKLSLTANHLEAFLILVAVGFNLLEEIKQIFDFDEQDYINTYARELSQTAYLVCVLLLGVAVISLLFSIARTVIKFFDFKLTDSGKDWKIAFGLFNREQKTIPLNKVQILNWKASWLRRKFDYWIMHIQVVGNNDKNVKKHIQIPILSFSELLKLSDSYQTFTGFRHEDANKIQPEYWKRKALTIGLPFSIISMLISWYWIGWWAAGFILILIYVTAFYYKAWKNFRWETPAEGIQLLSGAWGRKYTLLNWKKIQQVHIRQSIYQRNHQLADVLFITAGGKILLPYIALSTATALVDYVVYYVESKNENWM